MSREACVRHRINQRQKASSAEASRGHVNAPSPPLRDIGLSHAHKHHGRYRTLNSLSKASSLSFINRKDRADERPAKGSPEEQEPNPILCSWNQMVNYFERWSGEIVIMITLPDLHPMATVDASTADGPGRYAGGSHSILSEFQVIHVESLSSPAPRHSM